MSKDVTSKNIFKISNPQEWWCRVSSLASTHTTMRIDLFHLEKEKQVNFSHVMYLEFRKVAYFSGWLTWVNANFRQAEIAEKAQFIRRVSHINNVLLDDELANSPEFATLTLFIAEGEEGKQTHILANAARLLDNNNSTLLEVG